MLQHFAEVGVVLAEVRSILEDVVVLVRVAVHIGIFDVVRQLHLIVGLFAFCGRFFDGFRFGVVPARRASGCGPGSDRPD